MNVSTMFAAYVLAVVLAWAAWLRWDNGALRGNLLLMAALAVTAFPLWGLP